MYIFKQFDVPRKARSTSHYPPCLGNEMRSIIVLFHIGFLQYNFQSIRKLRSIYKKCFINSFLMNKEQWINDLDLLEGQGQSNYYDEKIIASYSDFETTCLSTILQKEAQIYYLT